MIIILIILLILSISTGFILLFISIKDKDDFYAFLSALCFISFGVIITVLINYKNICGSNEIKYTITNYSKDKTNFTVIYHNKESIDTIPIDSIIVIKK